MKETPIVERQQMNGKHLAKAHGPNTEVVGFYRRVFIPKDGGGFKTVEIPEYSRMAEFCQEQKKYCFDDTISLRFDGKKWDWFTKTALLNFVMEQNAECIKPAHLDGFMRMIRGKCLSSAIPWKSADGMINVNNGIIDVKSGELRPHSHEYLFKYCSPVDFDPKAEAPRWAQFLVDTFEGNVELIDLAQRLFGYILIGGRPFLHRAFVLYGSGRNGKSTFLDILRAVLGRGTYSVVSMAKIDKEFSAVSIDGKLANIVEETPTDEINAEAFKNLVGGGEVQAAHKGFDEYSFQCNARFVFACNDMPVFKDRTIGLEERLVFIPFNRYLSEETRDEHILDKLLAEMPGIFNWAVEGAQMMLRERKLPKYEAVINTKELYRQETDPLYAWVSNCVYVGRAAENMSVSDVYSKYKNQMDDEGHRPFSKNKFIKRFRALLEQKCRANGIAYDPDYKFYETPLGVGKQFRGFNVITKIEP